MSNLAKKAKVFFCMLLSCLLINYLSGVALAAVPITWSFTTVDTGGTETNVGTHLSLDYRGGVYYMSYYDATQKALIFAECDTSTQDCKDESDWTKTTVDDNGDVGQYSSVWGRAISYYDATNDHLKFAWYEVTGSGNCRPNSDWSCVTVDDSANVGKYTSLTFPSMMMVTQCPYSYQAQISYYDEANSALKYATSTDSEAPCGETWDIETVDNTSSGFDGKGTSITWNTYADPERPAIAYSSEDSEGKGILRYAERVSGSDCSDSDWTCEEVYTLDGAKVGQYPSLAGFEGKTGWTSGISHYDAQNGNLYFSEGSLDGWNTTLVDANGDVGKFTDIAVGQIWGKYGGGPWHISYYDASDSPPALKYANGPVTTDGTCDDTGGASDWDCYKTNNPSRDSGDYGKYSSIVVSASGGPKGDAGIIKRAFAKNGGGAEANQVAIGYYNATQGSGDAKITFGEGPKPEPQAISEFKNYWYIVMTAVAALVLFFIVRWQFKRKEVKK